VQRRVAEGHAQPRGVGRGAGGERHPFHELVRRVGEPGGLPLGEGAEVVEAEGVVVAEARDLSRAPGAGDGERVAQASELAEKCAARTPRTSGGACHVFASIPT